MHGVLPSLLPLQATKVRKMNLTASSYATNYTVDLDDGLGPQTVVANFTIVSDPTEATPDLPLLMHMNGFNVLPAYHSRLVAELAKQGYTVVMTGVVLRANPNVNTPQRSARESSQLLAGQLACAVLGLACPGLARPGPALPGMAPC